jgi:hypothetical protein
VELREKPAISTSEGKFVRVFQALRKAIYLPIWLQRTRSRGMPPLCGLAPARFVA